MENGKITLEHGQRRLSEGKEEYREARKRHFLVWADKLFNRGKGFKKARKQIADGELEIAHGEEQVADGEIRAAAGRQKLLVGGERLIRAHVARVACAAGAVLLSTFTIVLGLRWK